MDGHLECVLWEFRQPNIHSEPINKPLVDELVDFPDIIYRNTNYVENLLATGINENKNTIFIRQFYIPKQREKREISKKMDSRKYELLFSPDDVHFLIL